MLTQQAHSTQSLGNSNCTLINLECPLMPKKKNACCSAGYPLLTGAAALAREFDALQVRLQPLFCSHKKERKRATLRACLAYAPKGAPRREFFFFDRDVTKPPGAKPGLVQVYIILQIYIYILRLYFYLNQLSYFFIFF